MKFRIIDGGTTYDLQYQDEDKEWRFVTCVGKSETGGFDKLKEFASNHASRGEVIEEFDI